MASIQGFSLDNIRTMPARDGEAVSCDILLNGTKIAVFHDGGCGGDYDLHGIDRRRLNRELRKLTPWYRNRMGSTGIDYGIDLDYDTGLLVDDLRNLMEAEKDFIAHSKTAKLTVHPKMRDRINMFMCVLWSGATVQYRCFKYMTLSDSTRLFAGSMAYEMAAKWRMEHPEDRCIVEKFYGPGDFNLSDPDVRIDLEVS